MPNTDVSNTKKPKLTPRKQGMLLRYIASGKPASQWLRKHKISSSDMYNLIERDPIFRKEYLRARQQMAHALTDDMLTISDNPDEEIQRSRLRVDSRKWLASKLNATAYGDKLQVETSTKVNILDHLNDIINVTPDRLESEQ